jgi:hypothetical protein
LDDRARAAAAEALLDRAWGKAPQHVDVDGVEPITVVIRHFNLNEDGEASAAAEAGSTAMPILLAGTQGRFSI